MNTNEIKISGGGVNPVFSEAKRAVMQRYPRAGMVKHGHHNPIYSVYDCVDIEAGRLHLGSASTEMHAWAVSAKQIQQHGNKETD